MPCIVSGVNFLVLHQPHSSPSVSDLAIPAPTTSSHSVISLCHLTIVSDIAIFVLKRDVKLQLTNCHLTTLTIPNSLSLSLRLKTYLFHRSFPPQTPLWP